jgi:hypothetical protein
MVLATVSTWSVNDYAKVYYISNAIQSVGGATGVYAHVSTGMWIRTRDLAISSPTYTLARQRGDKLVLMSSMSSAAALASWSISDGLITAGQWAKDAQGANIGIRCYVRTGAWGSGTKNLIMRTTMDPRKPNETKFVPLKLDTFTFRDVWRSTADSTMFITNSRCPHVGGPVFQTSSTFMYNYDPTNGGKVTYTAYLDASGAWRWVGDKNGVGKNEVVSWLQVYVAP